MAAIDVDDGYVFVIGGKTDISAAANDYLNDTFILNLSDLSWSLGPKMNNKRGHHACSSNANQDVIYSIGGMGAGPTYFDSVEILNVSNINDLTQSNWVSLSDTLSTALWGHRVIRDGDYILTVGGRYGVDGDNIASAMNIIDTTTNSISSSGALSVAVERTAAITIGDIAYAFGGGRFSEGSKGYTNAYQSLALLSSFCGIPFCLCLYMYYVHSGLTAEPTSDPTRPSTSSPSNQPTNNPTVMPVTTNPTKDPLPVTSYDPTFTPTRGFTTMVPSFAPSSKPTLDSDPYVL